jgi:hypothetical protein
MHSVFPFRKTVYALGQAFSTSSTVMSGWKIVLVFMCPKILHMGISLFALAQINTNEKARGIRVLLSFEPAGSLV